jgi:hypothetical protein
MYLTKNRQERCVMARVVRQRKLYQANFSLKEHGDWDKATAAAEKWLRSVLKNLPPPISRKGLMTANNSSGVVGVFQHRAVRKRRGRKKIYRSWIAWWPKCKTRGGVRWSVKKYGEDDAFVLAVLCRRLESPLRARVLEVLNETRRTIEYNKILQSRRGKQSRTPEPIVPAIDAAPPSDLDQGGFTPLKPV